MGVSKKIILFFIGTLISYLFSVYFGNLYEYFFGGGTWVDVRGIIGIPLAYSVFIPALFTAFGGKGKYWWIGILLIPAAWFELYFDPSHIYFPIVLGLIGWGVGYGVEKALAKSRKEPSPI